MKTAVSIPDELFERADAFAHRLGKSRSQVYREALSDYLARREPRSVMDALNEVASGVGSTSDPWLAAAGRAALERGEW